eukprot:scpid81559/ scgid23936/ 
MYFDSGCRTRAGTGGHIFTSHHCSTTALSVLNFANHACVISEYFGTITNISIKETYRSWHSRLSLGLVSLQNFFPELVMYSEKIAQCTGITGVQAGRCPSTSNSTSLGCMWHIPCFT